jgi:hypothetical protein
MQRGGAARARAYFWKDGTGPALRLVGPGPALKLVGTGPALKLVGPEPALKLVGSTTLSTYCRPENGHNSQFFFFCYYYVVCGFSPLIRGISWHCPITVSQRRYAPWWVLTAWVAYPWSLSSWGRSVSEALSPVGWYLSIAPLCRPILSNKRCHDVAFLKCMSRIFFFLWRILFRSINFVMNHQSRNAVSW